MAKFDKKALAKCAERIGKSPTGEDRRILVYSTNTWKYLRELGYQYADWSDDEIKNYNKETGLIGVRFGVQCYNSERFYNQQ